MTGIRRWLRRHYVGAIALFVALGGTTYAAGTAEDGPLPGTDQVGSLDIMDGQVLGADIGRDAVGLTEIKPELVRGEGRLISDAWDLDPNETAGVTRAGDPLDIDVICPSEPAGAGGLVAVNLVPANASVFVDSGGSDPAFVAGGTNLHAVGTSPGGDMLTIHYSDPDRVEIVWLSSASDESGCHVQSTQLIGSR